MHIGGATRETEMYIHKTHPWVDIDGHAIIDGHVVDGDGVSGTDGRYLGDVADDSDRMAALEASQRELADRLQRHLDWHTLGGPDNGPRGQSEPRRRHPLRPAS